MLTWCWPLCQVALTWLCFLCVAQYCNTWSLSSLWEFSHPGLRIFTPQCLWAFSLSHKAHGLWSLFNAMHCYTKLNLMKLVQCWYIVTQSWILVFIYKIHHMTPSFIVSYHSRRVPSWCWNQSNWFFFLSNWQTEHHKRCGSTIVLVLLLLVHVFVMSAIWRALP